MLLSRSVNGIDRPSNQLFDSFCTIIFGVLLIVITVVNGVGEKILALFLIIKTKDTISTGYASLDDNLMMYLVHLPPLVSRREGQPSLSTGE